MLTVIAIWSLGEGFYVEYFISSFTYILFVSQRKLDCFLLSDTAVLVLSSCDRLEGVTLVLKYEWHMIFIF